MKRLSKLSVITIVIVLLLMIILNPSYNSFKQFATDYKNKYRVVVHSRLKNYILFSIYEKKVLNLYEDEQHPTVEEDKKYVGILMNFIDISKKEPIKVIARIDTAFVLMATATDTAHRLADTSMIDVKADHSIIEYEEFIKKEKKAGRKYKGNALQYYFEKAWKNPKK